MTDREFVKSIKDEIFDKSLHRYFEILRTIDRDSITHMYWKATASLYDKLDHKGREQLRFFARLIMEDTLSSVLSYLDGSSTFATQEESEDFKLTSGEQVISGMLHDFFLATLEDEESDCRGTCSFGKDCG